MLNNVFECKKLLHLFHRLCLYKINNVPFFHILYNPLDDLNEFITEIK